ncbi:SprT-like domain-containing protein [Haloferula sargassicola]|uniref:SprT-like domain-containing protein n=1 Tax=Haloferula sargassicola TaxID=490096 RepID=A0ABP9UVU5_9BACT
MDHVRDYVTLSDCYDAFNERLFGGQLRGCVLTFEDRGQHFGYFREGGFVGHDGERRDEICLNPQFFLASSGDLELLQTLVHEQVHQWQYQFGTPSRRTYHNREWANKMLAVGLVPSTTGKPGGNMVGQKMADYPQEGGPFLRIAEEVLADKQLIRWYKEGAVIRRAQEYAAAPVEEVPPMVAAVAASMPAQAATGEAPAHPVAAPSKVSYRCPECSARAWGKPGLSLICGKCFDAGGEIVRLEMNAVYLQEKDRWVSAPT